jgi:hypothetical protein
MEPKEVAAGSLTRRPRTALLHCRRNSPCSRVLLQQGLLVLCLTSQASACTRGSNLHCPLLAGPTRRSLAPHRRSASRAQGPCPAAPGALPPAARPRTRPAPSEAAGIEQPLDTCLEPHVHTPSPLLPRRNPRRLCTHAEPPARASPAPPPPTSPDTAAQLNRAAPEIGPPARVNARRPRPIRGPCRRIHEWGRWGEAPAGQIWPGRGPAAACGPAAAGVGFGAERSTGEKRGWEGLGS